MSDLIRREDVLDILNDVDEGDIDSAYFAIRALPAAPHVSETRKSEHEDRNVLAKKDAEK